MNIIPDKAIVLDDDTDLLKTKTYSDVIYKIIKEKKDDDSLNIGLFGGWGSGKSSIVKTLEDMLKNEKDTKVMIYDAWKYSKDEFRRSFLIEIIKNFKITTSDFFEKLYQDKHEETESKLSFKTNWFAILLILILYFIFLLFLPVNYEFKAIYASSGVALALVFDRLLLLFTEYKKSVTTPKLFSPEQFEEVFEECIQRMCNSKILSYKWIKDQIYPNTKLKKVVFIIDNIDRCQRELACEVILTVKNFLDKKHCIFIIPVDEKSIKKNLDLKDEPDEFLRKFFNVTIRIKAYTEQDLYYYVKNLIKKNVSAKSTEEDSNIFNGTIYRMISFKFAKNPRRIIQFINNLFIEIEHAKIQEDKFYNNKNIITGNIALLVKVLIIREEWPEMYDFLNSNPVLLLDINDEIKNENIKEENGRFLYTKKNKNKEQDKEQNEEQTLFELTPNAYMFLRQTRTITCDNIVSFFRIIDKERVLPYDLMEMIDSYNWNSIKNKIHINQLKMNELWEVVLDKLHYAFNDKEQWESNGFNLLNLIFLIADDNDYENEFNKIYRDNEFEQFIDNDIIRGKINEFNPKALVGFAGKLFNNNKTYLRDIIFAAIKTKKQCIEKKEVQDNILDNELFKEYLSIFNSDKESLSKISELIDINNIDYFIKNYKDKLCDKDFTLAKLLFSNKFIENFEIFSPKSSSIDLITIENKLSSFFTICQQAKLLTNEHMNTYVEYILDLKNDNNISNVNTKIQLILVFIDDIDESNFKIVKNTANNIHHHIFRTIEKQNQYQRTQDTDHYIKLIIDLFKRIYIRDNDSIFPIEVIFKYSSLYYNEYLDESVDAVCEAIKNTIPKNLSMNKLLDFYNEIPQNHQRKGLVFKIFTELLKQYKKNPDIILTDNDFKGLLYIIFKSFENKKDISEDCLSLNCLNELIGIESIDVNIGDEIINFFGDNLTPHKINTIVSIINKLKVDSIKNKLLAYFIFITKDIEQLKSIMNDINDSQAHLKDSLIILLEKININCISSKIHILEYISKENKIFVITDSKAYDELFNRINSIFLLGNKEYKDKAVKMCNYFNKLPKETQKKLKR